MPKHKSILFLFLLLPLACLAQDDASQKIISKFSGYSAAHPTEKVYLHFDRPYYAAGDTIYYKAYLTFGETHKLSALSGVLHVELIDKLQGKALFIEKLEVTNDAKIMHCLPVRRNIEVSDELLDGSNSLVSRQGANRVWAAQAVLSEILSSK